MTSEKKSVLFVCLGNICRSPIAEAILAHLVDRKGLNDRWLIDSAALGPWHVGGPPDDRALAKLKENGIETDHKARMLVKEDFQQYDVIFGMDDDNIKGINQKRSKAGKAVVGLLGDYDPEGVRIIEDPYYGELEGFETVYKQCLRCCEAFLNKNL